MADEVKTLASSVDSGRESSALVAEACLSDDDILSFVQGGLADRSLTRVHSHIDACEVCQRLVVEAVHALDTAPISETARPSWNTVFQVNAIVGKRYRVLRLVARGGMGEVYEAYDSLLHERVALKTVTSTNCDSAQAVRNLKAEVQLARRISHPNVCRIYDFGTHMMEPSGSEVHFLVMEFIDGECLGKKLRQSGALPPELAQSIAHQLLLGLRAAHQAGILHRDFKSDNVMLCQESGGRMKPVILDFGLARVLNESGRTATTQGQGHGMVGTVGYMAPEQIEGESLSTASDLYAFGIVWFEMLTGRLPFEGDTPIALAMARLHRRPIVPSRLNPKVPSWVDDILLRCLSRDRASRFTSAQEVLDAVASGQANLANPSSAPRGDWRKWVVAALIFTALGVVAVLSTSRPHSRLRTETWAAMPFPVRQVGVRRLPSIPSAKALLLPSTVTRGAAPKVGKTNGKPNSSELPDRRTPPVDQGAGPANPADAPAPVVPESNATATTQAKPAPVRKSPDWLPIWSRKSDSKAPATVEQGTTR